MAKVEIPEDTKMFLRAVLISSPGMQQSQVIKEYFQITGETIQYTKYGFKNFYEFLLSLQGDVTRMEFSPKHGGNIVFAVLDKTKYASKHAKKYASKSVTGMRAKTPEEILAWRKEMEASGKKLPVTVKKVSSRHNRNRHNQLKKGGNVKKEMRKEVPASTNDWFLLRKLIPNADKSFSLSLKNIGINQRIVKNKFLQNPKALQTHFSAYNLISGSMKIPTDSRQPTTLSFSTFFNAYRAWKEKDRSIVLGHRIGIEPVGGNMNALATTGVHSIIVLQFPQGIVMSTFVTAFAKFPGLVSIYARPTENCVIISYTTLESAENACKDVNIMTVGGRKVPINIRTLDEKPSISFVSMDNLTVEKKLSSRPITPASTSSSSSTTRPRTPAVLETNEEPTSTMSRDELAGGSYDDRACGFCMNYQQTFQMFQITCRKKPMTLENVDDLIRFIVTYQIEPIRFWAWVMNSNDSIQKLAEIEKKIAVAAVKIQPPHVLPKEGHRGAALYKDKRKESDPGSWFRCYVLSSNSNTDEITIFYCDYGNSESIPRERFRSTYNDIWTLPPQAVPLKMFGVELKDPDNPARKTQGFDLENNQVFEATVVKSSVYSQPHIMEIKNVSSIPSYEVIDDKIISAFCVPVGEKYKPNLDVCNEDNSNMETIGRGKIEIEANGNSDTTNQDHGGNGDLSEECKPDEGKEITETSGKFMESIFDYDEDDLVLGLLSETHTPDLVYLKLGDMNGFGELGILIDELDLSLPNNLEKGDTVLLSVNGQRRRVLALQVLRCFNKCKVLHVDYGVIEWVFIDNLYKLPNDLQEAPFQARPAALAGIDYSEKKVEATQYLKGKSKLVIKANVIHESSSGKIRVELFDVQAQKSLNREMIEQNLAKRMINDITETDEEVLPNMIPIPVKELEMHVPQSGILPPPSKEETCNLPVDLLLRNLCIEAAQGNVGLTAQTQVGLAAQIQAQLGLAAQAQAQLGLAAQAQAQLGLAAQAQAQLGLAAQAQAQLGLAAQAQADISAKAQAGLAAQGSSVSWHSQSQNPFQDEPTHRDVPCLPDGSAIPKLMDVNTWIDNSPLKFMPLEDGGKAMPHHSKDGGEAMPHHSKDGGEAMPHHSKVEENTIDNIADDSAMNKDISYNYESDDVFSENEAENNYENNHKKKDMQSACVDSNEIPRNDTSYPPPDIISSTKVHKGIAIEGREVQIGDDEVINVGTDNKLNSEEIYALCEKWNVEKTYLWGLKKRLENVLTMSDDELTCYFQKMRKEKLKMKLYIKKREKDLVSLESEHRSIIGEMNHILSLI